MLYLRRSILLLMLIALVGGVTGCAEREPPKPAEPPPPPPPTPEEIATKVIADSGLNEPLPAAGAPFPKEAADKLKRALGTAKRANSTSPDGQRALQIINQHVDQRIRTLEDSQAWEHALGTIEGYEALNPGSKKWETSKERALTELQKPKIEIIGFMQDTAILEYYLPIAKQTNRRSVRAGEEFDGVTLVEVIGNNQGVRMRYGATGETFDVFTKSAQTPK